MMETHVQATPSAGQILYGNLNRFLLFFIGGEFAYIILLIISFVTFFILDLTSHLSSFSVFGRVILWSLLPLVVALLLNMICGIAGIVLNISTRHEGYPGTGHTLNWLLCAVSAWFFVMMIFVLSFTSTLSID